MLAASPIQGLLQRLGRDHPECGRHAGRLVHGADAAGSLTGDVVEVEIPGVSRVTNPVQESR